MKQQHKWCHLTKAQLQKLSASWISTSPTNNTYLYIHYAFDLYIQALANGKYSHKGDLTENKKFGEMMSTLFSTKWEETGMNSNLLLFAVSWPPMVQFFTMFCKCFYNFWRSCYLSTFFFYISVLIQNKTCRREESQRDSDEWLSKTINRRCCIFGAVAKWSSEWQYSDWRFGADTKCRRTLYGYECNNLEIQKTIRHG